MEDFGAQQTSDVTEVTFISLLWVQGKALKSVHHTEDSNKSTLIITEEWQKKNYRREVDFVPITSASGCCNTDTPWTCLKETSEGILSTTHIKSNSKYSQNVCWSRKPAGFPSKGFFFPQFRKVMGLVPHANKQDRKEVICFHTFPTSNKRHLVYRR